MLLFDENDVKEMFLTGFTDVRPQDAETGLSILSKSNNYELYRSPALLKRKHEINSFGELRPSSNNSHDTDYSADEPHSCI